MMIKLKPEAQFEKDLAVIASVSGCYYVKIQDTRSINRSNRGTHKEVKRICDSIIVTPTANWFCECKIDYNTLEKHQVRLQGISYAHNGLFVVLRKVRLKNRIVYRINTKFGDWETQDIREIFTKLKELA